MIYVINRAVTYGLDAKIKMIQMQLKNKLTWLGDIYIFGKIRPTPKNDKIVPQVYNHITGEYMDIFIDDTVAGTIGFHLLDHDYKNHIKKAILRVIFTLDLTQIHENETYEKERSRLEALKILEHSGYINNIVDIHELIPNVFEGFDNESIIYRDMYPFNVFAIDIDINYTSDICGRDDIEQYIFEEMEEFYTEEGEQLIFE